MPCRLLSGYGVNVVIIAIGCGPPSRVDFKTKITNAKVRSHFRPHQTRQRGSNVHRNWIWGIAGVAAGLAVGLSVPYAIHHLNKVPIQSPSQALPPSPPLPDQAQRMAFIADCIDAARGSIKTPSTLRIIGKPRYIRHEKEGRFYLDVILDYDSQNIFGAIVRSNNVFCSTSIDKIYGKIDTSNIEIDGITNFDRAMNDLKADIPEAKMAPIDLDVSEFVYAMQHGA